MLALLMKCCSDPGSGPQALRRAKQASVVVIDATGIGIWLYSYTQELFYKSIGGINGKLMK